MPIPLALEIYHLIIKQIDNKSDLRSSALCCSIFRDEAQRCLFSVFDDHYRWHLQRKKFLSAINDDPQRLGPLVHTFSIEEWVPIHDDDVVSLSKALHAMPNLKHLKLNWQKPSTVLHGCTFQLSTFVCGWDLVGPEAPFILSDFLPTQRGVKHLGIRL